ncbi:hypothetical protein [Ornithinimicrobium kibberense]|uniref:hypothetical protein n=1 Tax=Ornithinimicrobium kibberense TaxID=282060 RepID=UPI003623108A
MRGLHLGVAGRGGVAHGGGQGLLGLGGQGQIHGLPTSRSIGQGTLHRTTRPKLSLFRSSSATAARRPAQPTGGASSCRLSAITTAPRKNPTSDWV